MCLIRTSVLLLLLVVPLNSSLCFKKNILKATVFYTELGVGGEEKGATRTQHCTPDLPFFCDHATTISSLTSAS